MKRLWVLMATAFERVLPSCPDLKDQLAVGSLDAASGLFTPALDGPNDQRSGSRNNVGDVWVVATVEPEAGGGAGAGKPLRARAHLLVTVPLYSRWDASATP